MTEEAHRLPPTPLSHVLPLRLPAALVYLYDPAISSRGWRQTAEAIGAHAPALEPLHSGLFICRPRPRRPNAVDGATDAVSRLLATGAGVLPCSPDEVRALVAPATVEAHGESISLEMDPLSRAINALPRLEMDGGIYLTSRAAASLEGSWQFTDGGELSTRSTPPVPLRRVVGWSDDDCRRVRNREILGRRVEFVPRPALTEEIRVALGEGVLRVTGPLGAGKSRLLHELAGSLESAVVWVSLFPHGRPLAESLLRRALAAIEHPTAEEIIQQIDRSSAQRRAGDVEAHLASLFRKLLTSANRRAQRSYLVVCDDCHAASAAELSFLAELAELDVDPERVSLVFAGRSGGSWLDALEASRTIEVPPLSEEERADLGERLTRGLDMPDALVQRFAEASGGLPFALEEGLLELVHRGILRRVYGSFFFSGDSDLAFRPSSRLVQHVYSEACRHASHAPLTVLAAAERPLPADTVTSAVEVLGLPDAPDWAMRCHAARWIETISSPWGPAVDLVSPAYGAALRTVLTEAGLQKLQESVGRVLRDEDQSASGAWQVYELLEGTDEGIQLLLERITSDPGSSPPDQVFRALQNELTVLRQRGGDEETELELLWVLIPLGRRLGIGHELTPEIERALDLARGDSQRIVALSTTLAELELEHGRPRDAESYLRRSLEIAVDMGPKPRRIIATELARLLIQDERYEEARTVLEALLRELDDDSARAATCRFLLGNLALHEQRYEDAVELHTRALDIRESRGRAERIGASLCALGATYLQMGNYPQALSHYERAVATLEEDAEDELGYALLGLGSTLAALGQFTSAGLPLSRALELRKNSGHAGIGEALARLRLAENHLQLERVDLAIADARRAHFALSLLEQTPVLGDAERLLGRILLKRRQADEARARFEAAERVHSEHGQWEELVADRACLLQVALAEGDRERIELLVRRLEDNLSNPPLPTRRELYEFRLFEGLEWLEQHGFQPPAPPLRYLRRAYQELMRKTAYLAPDQRAPFLLQVPQHEAIVDAATRHGLSLPEL